MKITYPSDWGKADQSMIKMLNPASLSNSSVYISRHNSIMLIADVFLKH
jgi:hypothetical protein